MRSHSESRGSLHLFSSRSWSQLLLEGSLRPAWPPGAACDSVTTYDSGDTKRIPLDEDDMARYTFAAAEDSRTENKIMYAGLESCWKSQNELVAMWEEKLGHKLEKKHVSKEDMVKTISELPFPNNFFMSFIYSYMVAGYKP